MSATGKPIHGKLCKLYIEPDADLESPTWALAGKIQGLNKTGSRNVAEIAERGEDEVLTLVSHKNKEVSFELTRRPGDSTYDLIEAAFESGEKIGAGIMTGLMSTVGSRGYQAEMYVTQFDDDQGHEGTACSVTLRPAADYVTAPAFVVVTA